MLLMAELLADPRVLLPPKRVLLDPRALLLTCRLLANHQALLLPICGLPALLHLRMSELLTHLKSRRLLLRGET